MGRGTLKDAFASGNFTEEEADIFVTDLCLWKALRGMRPDQRLRVSSPSGKPIPYRRGVNWWKIKNPAYSQAEGRHELFNGDWRAIARLRGNSANLRVRFRLDRQNPE